MPIICYFQDHKTLLVRSRDSCKQCYSKYRAFTFYLCKSTSYLLIYLLSTDFQISGADMWPMPTLIWCCC